MGYYIRNRDGHWVNTRPFREAALHFKKYGYYTEYPEGHPLWLEYWKEQLRRMKEGYCVEGACITGAHYYYLNFTRIKLTDPKTGRKTVDFPAFWDWDYNYFWAVHIARNGMSKKKYNKLKLDINIREDCLSGGRNLVVLKARRKGYSWKNASYISYVYNTVRESLSIIGAYDSTYSMETFKKASKIIDFNNEYTGFYKKQLRNDKEKGYIKSGYKVRKNGSWVEKGYLSEIETITFKDNPDAARGKDTEVIIFEEAGKFPNLIASYKATIDAAKDGDYNTGLIIIFGTSTDMEGGADDLEEMFFNPDDYELLAIENTFDEETRGNYIGFFHGTQHNRFRYYDAAGNSFVDKVIEEEMKKRAKITNSVALRARKIEHPLKPEEAFAAKKNHIFPVEELKAHERRLQQTKLYEKEATKVDLYVEDGIVKWRLADKDVDPIYFYKKEVKDPTSAVLIYEFPIKDPPFGSYIIGYDPYAQENGSSYAAIYVYKQHIIGESTYNIIVARYVGRPYSIEDSNRIALLLAKFYNAKVMVENMFVHVINYFRRNKSLHYLAAKPENVINKHIKNSKAARLYGIHMTRELKDAGLSYLKDWLIEIIDYDDTGRAIQRLETILDIGLIQEFIKYNDKDNFDRVMAVMMIMFLIEENRNIKFQKDKDKTDWLDEVSNVIKTRKKKVL